MGCLCSQSKLHTRVAWEKLCAVDGVQKSSTMQVAFFQLYSGTTGLPVGDLHPKSTVTCLLHNFVKRMSCPQQYTISTNSWRNNTLTPPFGMQIHPWPVSIHRLQLLNRHLWRPNGSHSLDSQSRGVFLSSLLDGHWTYESVVAFFLLLAHNFTIQV